MPSIDEASAAIARDITQTDQTTAGITDSKNKLTELASLFAQLGADGKAAESHAIAIDLDEATTKAVELRAILDGAHTRTESLHGTLLTNPAFPVASAPPQRPSRGWNNAPDLIAARDAMPRLGHVSLAREIHILDGDGDGHSGGHRWDSEIPGKMKFPRWWDDPKIIKAVTDVAQHPDQTPIARRRGGWVCTGIRDGVEIRVITNNDGSIWTAHPLGGQGVETNPKGA